VQVENGSYNVLGRLGPHYPKPEHRPKSSPGGVVEQERPSVGQDRTSQERSGGLADKTDLSLRPQRAQTTAAVVPEGRLNLQAAKNLTAETAAVISRLDPLSRSVHLPETDVGLLPSRYI
jgi:hypothetical protein